MATGQSILNIMEDLNGELQLQTGESDVAKALRAINAAQDMFETVLASHPRVAGSTTGTVATTANQEHTTFPTGLLRLDKLWLLDANSRPLWRVLPIKEAGAHALGNGWVASLVATSATGKPRHYWTNGTNIYWDPRPNGIHTVRWYGFQMAADVTAGATFPYNDAFLYPLATLASRIMKTALDDPPEDMLTLAKDMFTPLIEAMSNFNRDGATSMVYENRHDT